MKGFCPVCEKFVDVRVESKVVNIKVKGVSVKATQKFAYCLKHNSIAYVEEIEKENDITIYDEYKRIKGLMLAHEVKELRESYGLTQSSFAIILGFGEKTITRYENGAIQDESQNNVLNLMKDYHNFFQLWDKNKGKLKAKEVKKVDEFLSDHYFDYYLRKEQRVLVYKISNELSTYALNGGHAVQGGC